MRRGRTGPASFVIFPFTVIPVPWFAASWGMLPRRGMRLDVKESTEAQESPRSPQDNPARGWLPYPSMGMGVGAGSTLIAAACAVAAGIYLYGRPIAIDSFAAGAAGLFALALALLAGVLTWGSRSLCYHLSDHELTIRWLWIQEIIPLGRIEGLYGGHRLDKNIRVVGLTWPGHYVGSARAEGLGRLKYYGTTRDTSAVLIVGTPQCGYVLTPADLEGFRAGLIERLEAIPDEEIEMAPQARTRMPGLLRLSALRDGVVGVSLAIAILALLGSFGYVSAQFPRLPELMPLHFNFAGEPDLIGPPRDAFRMPLIGLFILLANGVLVAAVHGWQRDAARVLAAATIFVQLVMLIAVIRVVH